VKPKRDRLRILKEKAWLLQSEFIRLRDKGICFTCGARNWDEELGEWSIKGMQAGHFRHGVLDFDDDNLKCQCLRCNHFLSGNLAEYSRRLIKERGLDSVEKLHLKADNALKGEKLGEDDYKKLIEKIKSKIHRLSTP